MKKYFYSLGAITLALNGGGLPAMPSVPGVPAVAVPVPTSIGGLELEGQDIDVREGSVRVGNIQVNTTSAGADVRVGDVRVGSDEEGRADVQVGNVRVRADEQGRANVQVGDIEVNADGEDDSITVGGVKFELERNVTSAFSFDGLKRSIEQRKQELKDELASTTSSKDQNILEGANQVRLAVHALLASKDLLGGIGTQVSQIAQQMNDLVATATNAETKIQSRGFFSKLLFGGDSGTAEMISEEVAKSQENVQKLTGLLNQANISADVQATLKSQIDALQAEQARLQGLAQKEKSRWGIFSWRFF